MKVDTRYGSIWDELPKGTPKKIPETQSEAMEFYEAAQSSVDKSLLKTWDAHNDMMKKSAELRQISQRKKILEQRNIERRERQSELIKKEAEKRREKEIL